MNENPIKEALELAYWAAKGEDKPVWSRDMTQAAKTNLHNLEIAMATMTAAQIVTIQEVLTWIAAHHYHDSLTPL